MQFQTVLFERREAAVHVTMNRPDRLNALDGQLIADLRAAADAIAADGGVRAVVLTGAGRAFCAGADLMRGGVLDAAGSSPGAGVGAALRDQFNPMVSAWFHLRAPVIVAVNGVAAGAGANLALVGDLVIAARSASFLQLFAPKLGLLPDLGGTYFLPRSIGTARAKGLALLGDELGAEDAARWGLIWEAVDDTALAATVDALAQRLARGPSRAYAEIKAVFNGPSAASLDAQLARAAAAQSTLADTADFVEGLTAFLGRRAPRFSGS
jgi:2-(1,2-epoxy-1,2-dihydrophenyl)acetyl-CoA isomerase